MSWYALGFIALMVIATIAIFIKWNWPRNRDGSMMSLDEVSEFLDKMPSGGTTKAMVMVVIGFFATIAMFAVAITRRKEYNPDTNFDSDYHD